MSDVVSKFLHAAGLPLRGFRCELTNIFLGTGFGCLLCLHRSVPERC